MQPIIPPQPTAATIATVQAATSITPVDLSVTSTPPNLNQLLRQIQINGTVSSSADNGTVTLSTALGDFSLSLSQLPDNTKQQLQQQLDNLFQSQKPITVTIQPGSPPSQAVLLMPSSPPSIENAPTNLQPVVPQPSTITAGSTIPAVVLPRDLAVTGSNNPAQNLAPAASPLGDNAATPPTSAFQASENADPHGQQQSQLPTPSPAPLFQPGKEVMLQVDAVALPGEELPEPTGGQIGASVIANGANGQLIVKTTDDTALYIRSSVEAPVGTNLLVKIEAPKAPPPTVLPQVDSQNFQSLQQTLAAVTQINPQLAQQMLESRMPQANGQLTGPLLFFLIALRQGDAKGWLGNDVADSLSGAGKLELLAKLGHAMETSSQIERDPTVGEWKSYPVPLHNNGEFQTLMLHVHGDKRGSSSPGSSNAAADHVRFLIDVRMSKFGPMQLDGLVRPKKLDMIVRSEKALPPGLPQELRVSYLNTIEALGYTGGLSFQNGRQNWLTPIKTETERGQSRIT